MKLHTYRYLAVPVVAACCLTSCKDEGPKEPSVPQAPQIKTATPAERSASLALLDLVPAESSCVFTLYDIPSVVQSFMASHTGEYINSANQLNDDASIGEDEEKEAVPAETEVDTTKLMAGADNASAAASSKPDISIGVKNVAIAGGSDIPALLTKLAPLVKKYAEISQGNSIPIIAGSHFSNSVSQDELQGMAQEMSQELMKLGIEMLDQIDLESETGSAPLMIAAELDDEAMTQTKASMAQLSMMAGVMSQGALMPSTFESGGISFTGVKLDGPKASKLVAASLAGSGLDTAIVNKIINKVSTAKLHLLIGFKGNACLAVLCANPQTQLKIPASAAESILGKQEFAFVDGHLSSQAFSVAMATPSLIKSLLDVTKANSEGSSNGMIAGLKKVQKSLNLDKAKVDEMCSSLAKNAVEGEKMYSLYDVTQPASCYTWWDKGLMGEVVIGSDATFDWNRSAASMSGLLNVQDNAFSAVMSLSSGYQDIVMNICENSGKLVWNAVELLATTKNDEKKIGHFYNTAKPFVPLISSIWTATKSNAGYDPVQGIVVDLNGVIPNDKAIPASIAKDGRIPRIASIARVTDMSKLSAEWAAVRKALEANKAILQPLTGDVDLAKPTEEKGADGLTFYSYSFPHMSNDWTPAFAVGDSLVSASTSRNFIAPVVQASLKPDVSAIVPAVYGPLGACMRMDTAPWAKFIGSWAQALEASELKDEDAASYTRTAADVLNAISKDIKGIRVSISQENGKTVERFFVENVK